MAPVEAFLWPGGILWEVLERLELMNTVFRFSSDCRMGKHGG
jgi:hypothetical protein